MKITDQAKVFIKNNEKLNFLRVCVQQAATKDGRARVAGIKTDSGNVVFHHFGNENYGKIVYVIDPVNSFTSGLFSNFNSLLQYLCTADLLGFVPVVKCSEESIYFESNFQDDEQIFNTRNFFEYYFEQPMGISVENAENSAAVVFSETKQRTLALKNSREQQEQIYVQMLKKYIRFNEPTLTLLNDAKKRMLQGKKTLGVKYRGTDYFRGFKNHPIPCTSKEIIDVTRKVFERGKYDQIFLATEETEALEAFKEEFGNVLCYFEDVERYGRGENVMVGMDKSIAQYPRYKLGLEVIRDTWILAHTDGFVGSQSGVTLYANLFNKAYAPCLYGEKHIIDHGIFQKGANSIKYNEKFLNQYNKKK